MFEGWDGPVEVFHRSGLRAGTKRKRCGGMSWRAIEKALHIPQTTIKTFKGVWRPKTAVQKVSLSGVGSVKQTKEVGISVSACSKLHLFCTSAGRQTAILGFK
jgi:hypothetical protein